jgi:hypothetical protein
MMGSRGLVFAISFLAEQRWSSRIQSAERATMARDQKIAAPPSSVMSLRRAS